MSTKNVANREHQQSSDQNLVAGLTKHASTLTSLTFGGTQHPTAAILAVLNARIASADAVVSTRATWQSAVKADRDGRANTRAFVSGVRQALQLAFAGSIDGLADFGLSPRKVPAPRSPEAKVASVAKSKATRAARHTMGSKQKAMIKGTVATTAPTVPAPAATALLVPATSK
jgi:hypothetical protein